ncbi:hypothetical protein [Autumnicola musiva]|uniref:Response regulatory domain-containing protein n=1 Tax=Autumnicola musiva TaxID=3075589 RepID=A0ABU3D647_9FLAO|nr:hypothetical protein [Zunongwangia sp. F117]MDT0677006.1 hypothetical protein [Zunongwangia sp. F117]
MNIKVLWIDDLYKTQQDIIGEAEQDDIDIIPFESHEEGINELKKNPIYDAVILDAKVKFKKDDTVTDLNGLRASRDFLIDLNKTNYLPFFIFTGQPDYTEKEWFEQSYGNYYIKGEDNESLFQDILKSQEKRPEIQARKEFPGSFQCFDEGILGNSDKTNFLEIIKCFKEQDYRKKNINSQRDLLEGIFVGLNNPIPCIPNSFFNNGKPNQEWCVRFLENRPTDDSNGETHRLDKNIPRDIKAAIRKLKESTNRYSHLNDKAEVKMPFLSNFFLIQEVLCWLTVFCNDPHYRNYF